MFRLSLLTGLVFAGAAAVTAAAELPEPAAIQVDFVRDVHAILAERCYECHGNGKRKGELQLDSREGLLKGGENGPAILEGNSAESHLIQLVTATDPDDRMPPKGDPLKPEEIAILRAWIDQGLNWNMAAPEKAEYTAPLKLIESADLVAARTETNLIDRYLGAWHESRGETYGEALEDARFARHVWLDTAGLLPPVDQLQTFLADPAPNKREALIDRLLADKQAYTEHWISFWNDLLRNDFEGTGYIDGGREQISDWLYTALYENKPYDQFVRELVAPVPGANGFVKGIVWRGDNAAVQQAPMQAARNIAQVFLGVNLKCASCHDSFIDAWQLRDAYGFANVFSETSLELVRCETATGAMADYRFLWPDVGSIDGALPVDERRKQAAALVTSTENGFFARTIVNRVWALLIGRGIVEPLDSVEREPWYPELLDALARDFIAHNHDMKHLLKTIMASRLYQTAVPDADEAEHPHFAVRRMTSEEFYDALSTLTGVWQYNPKFLLPEERTPEEAARQEALRQAAAGGKSEQATADAKNIENRRRPVRAWRIPADSLTRALGRTPREQVTTRRESVATTLQALELSNGNMLAEFLGVGAQSLKQRYGADAPGLVDYLFMQGLQRSPTPDEKEVAFALLGEEAAQEGIEDLLWIVAMLPEFQLIR
ncbi:MAG: DUF1549 domain-containing protein [Candidatus Hydrogenedentes bacterium]|nr:DUF1549 domain-containing protein [Candidatus Hydrogenedentota bacterium]